MATPRRSRMHRSSTGKHLALTPRDLEIFKALCRYRYLRSTYLHAFVGGASETRFKERLGDLFHEGYIDRPSQQWQFASALHSPVLYELGDRAKKIVQDHVGPHEARTFLTQTTHRQFLHSVMICECLASFELAAKRSEGLRFIPWPEILAKAPEATQSSAVPFHIPANSFADGIVPDGAFGLEYADSGKKSYRFFALEVDRGTMPVSRADKTQTSLLAKLVAYREIVARQLHKKHWGIPNLLVLTVTVSAQRLGNLLTAVVADGGDNSALLLRSLEGSGLSTPLDALLSGPWERAGRAPLCIARSS